ncbi:hypothetical protein [Stutzerimonas stutzeri]|uniref:hypothetical protein n=2 Tax=Stutzerimonas stutzeri TaxID=316 RepID=UPI001F24F3E4|nr:hypothetical protein [Stutzerimonas stutzeri]
MSEENYEVTTVPTVIDAPNAINEQVEAFSVLGFGTSAGPSVHIQLARDFPDIIDLGAQIEMSNIKIIRRRVATLAMPASVAQALAQAILETVKSQQPG